MYDLNLALFCELLQSAGELVHDALFPAADFVDVDRRCGEGDAVMRNLVSFGDDFRDMQQRLGRDAADVQAHATQTCMLLDQDHLFAQVCGAECCGVAAGTCTENHDFGMQ